METVRNWDDRLESALIAARLPTRSALRAGAAPSRPAIATRPTPKPALKDIAEIEALVGSDQVGVEFIKAAGDGAAEFHSRLYHQGEAIALGRRLPILENLGLQAISETTHVLSPASSRWQPGRHS